MKRNLTLALDECVLENARIVAARRRTTVNRLVTGFLAGLGESSELRDRAVARLADRLRDPPLSVGDAHWTREDLHERK
jgi:hypothetical protein